MRPVSVTESNHTSSLGHIAVDSVLARLQNMIIGVVATVPSGEVVAITKKRDDKVWIGCKHETAPINYLPGHPH